MPKRKYVHTNMSSIADRCHKLRQYQTMTETECLERLLDIQDNKSTCTKFCKHSSLTPTSHNMVTTSHINSNVADIDLKTIALCMKNTSYDRRRFAAITIRLHSPKTTALLFSSGIMPRESVSWHCGVFESWRLGVLAFFVSWCFCVLAIILLFC